MRLDLYLVEKYAVESRNRAIALIKSGSVAIDGIVVRKPSFRVEAENSITIDREHASLKYVARSAEKLKYALDHFDFQVKGKVVLDIGASTGGFTQILLGYGAGKIYAVDVGKDQLHSSLKNNPRVVNLENTNARELDKTLFSPVPDIFVMDVSFISSTKIVGCLLNIVKEKKGIVLFKPQFEQELLGQGKKRDVIKKEEPIRKMQREFGRFCSLHGIEIKDIVASPVTGEKGNREFLYYLYKIS